MSNNDKTLKGLLTDSKLESVGELYCTVFEHQEKLDALFAKGEEKSNDANVLKGLLENLEPIVAFAKVVVSKSYSNI